MRTAGPELPGVLGEVGVLAEGGYPSNKNNNNKYINMKQLLEPITNPANTLLGIMASPKLP